MLWIQFLICVIVVVAASSVLSRYADVIAEKTGLGRAWVRWRFSRSGHRARSVFIF